MTVTVSEREEQAFLDFILDLARKEMASSVRQDSDEATEVRRELALGERIAR